MGVPAEVDHLRSGVGLLGVVGDRHAVEFPHTVVALEHAGRVLPRDGAAGLDLRPTDLRACVANAALRHEVEDAPAAVLVPGVPVLHRAVLDLRIVQSDELDDSGVQLVFVALRCRAPLEVTDVRRLIGDDEGALELACACLIDPEVRTQLHRTTHPFRNVAERTIGENRRIQRREVIVPHRHHGAQILAHQLRMLANRFTHRTENDAELGQLFFERRSHRHTVHHKINGNT